MFNGIGNMMEVLRHAGRLRSEMDRINEDLKRLEVEGSAGGGMVRIRMTGKRELLDCKIDPHVFADHDTEMLEDLVVAAVSQALEKAKAAATDRYGKMFGGLNIAGLPEALAQLGDGSFGT